MQFPDAKLLIFARAPVEGQVKTRLASSIGTAAACRLHAQLLEKTFNTLIGAKLAPVSCYTTDVEHPFFDHWKTAGVTFARQQGADLGESMRQAFSSELETASMVLLLGSDCPVINSAYLQQALVTLDSGNDAVIAPAEDGGYVLIGLKKMYPEIFQQVNWGTDKVLQQTLSHFENLSLAWQQLETLWDVDTAKDYQRWQALQDSIKS